MNTFEWDDLIDDLHKGNDHGDDLVEACWDAYYDALRKFYSLNKKTQKEWEELNWYEVEQIKRDYEWDKQQDERITDPEMFYGTAGTR